MGLLNSFRTANNRPNLLQEVVEHVSDLLNTKKTFGSYSKDLGLSDCDGSLQQIVKQLIEDMRRCLETFEPRIQVIDIQPSVTKKPFLLSFIIRFTLNRSAHAVHLSFQGKEDFSVRLET